MITKAQVKEIRSLATAKARDERKAFLVEGDKLVREWLNAAGDITHIVALQTWITRNEALIALHPEALLIPVTEEELGRCATLKTPNDALVVVPLPEPPVHLPVDEWCIALDTVQDPGNLGAIIRIADWFGIGHVVCSPGCADYYNPKVVGAAMGGHLRVQLHSAPLAQFLASCNMPVIAATLSGSPVTSMDPLPAAVLVIGNESKGISPEVLAHATKEVTIPKRGGAESLNAAVSAGILVALLLPE